MSLRETASTRLNETRRRVRQSDPARKAAREGERLLRRRWRRGIDRHGRKMPSYALSTVRRKRRQGRPTVPANVIDTEHTIGAVAVRSPRQGRSEIYLRSTLARRRLGYHVRGAGRLPIRDPWGFTRRERTQLMRRYHVRITRSIPTGRRTHRKTIRTAT